jgi:Cys-tRNA(Pro)/Cys-tRNA(Cys) deacylase
VAGGKAASGATPATVALARAKRAFTTHEYDSAAEPGQGYGPAAAAALGVDPERLFKTLVVSAGSGGDQLAVAIVAVADQLDLKAAAHALGVKSVRLAEQAAAERATGYVVGGISPLGQRRRMPTVIDASARRFDTVYVSAGRRGLQVELAPADLIELTGATVAEIGRTS